MKEFLRFLMCIIIIAALVFVYMFLKEQNNIYDTNNEKDSGDRIEIVSGDTNNSGEQELSGDSGDINDNEPALSGDVQNSGDTNKDGEIPHDVKDIEKVSGDASSKNTINNNTKGNESGDITGVASGD